MRFKNLLMLLTFGLSCANAAQQPATVFDPTVSVPIVAAPAVDPTANSTPNPSQEIAILKAEVAAAQTFRTDTLSTIYWSLSTVAGVVLLLVGFSWWSNFKVYERDKQLLMDEMAARNTTQMASLNSKVTAALAEERGRMEKKASEEREYLHEKVKLLQGMISELAGQHRSDLETLRAERSELGKELRRRIAEIDWRVANGGRKAAQREGTHSIALSHAVVELEGAVDAGYPWRERDAIEGMILSLSKGGQFTSHELENTKRILDKVSNEHGNLKASLIAAMSKPEALWQEKKQGAHSLGEGPSSIADGSAVTLRSPPV